ncbi:MAG TPA: sugar kinase [Xanthobacteraceae bacterium]|nr:sugar kinase [Xanthobacteraceae bacterium]
MSEEQKTGVVCVGEVLIELARGSDGRFSPACGGDTFNVAIYLARAGLEVGFASAVGDDPYSNSVLALAAAEGVGSDLILRVPGRQPGLSLIENGPAGERITRYWRDGAPAGELFELPDWGRIAQRLTAARLVYFSGITLSLYSTSGLGRFLAALEIARQQGVKVAFDGNFRPRAWKGDLQRTRAIFIETLKRVDIALPAFDDEAVLWGDPSPESTVERLQAFGIGEIVVKNGPNSALVATGGGKDGHHEFVPVPEVLAPIDATAAGDAFNAAYLAARLSGTIPADAADAAHRLAGNVIRHPGSLLPRSAAGMH